MYAVQVDDTPQITVTSSKHEVRFAVDRSLMNPLEGFYATLAGCAAVYAKKACGELGIAAAGIEISCKPFAGTAGALSLAKFKTDVRFPAHFDAAQKEKVLDAISHCAVKAVVAAGNAVDFVVSEAA